MAELVILVHGVPAPQGSKRHVGNGVMVESSAKVRPWRQQVSAAAEAVVAAGDWSPGRLDPIALLVTFTLARPSSHYRTGKHAEQLKADAPSYPAGRPDLDKLLRSTLDALTDAGALVDDARVIAIRAEKAYVGSLLDSLDSPGAVITLATADR